LVFRGKDQTVKVRIQGSPSGQTFVGWCAYEPVFKRHGDGGAIQVRSGEIAAPSRRDTSPALPSAKDLLPGLKGLLRSGVLKKQILNRASGDPALRRLLGLRLFAHDDDDSIDDRAGNVHARLLEAADELGGQDTQLGRTVTALYGLHDPGRDYIYRTNRGAEAWEPDYKQARYFYRAKMNKVIPALAEQLLRMEKRKAMISTSRQMTNHLPVNAELAVDILHRYEDYYRIWTDAYALAADMSLFYDNKWTNPQDGARSEWAETTLYWLARMAYHLDLAIEKSGGIWIFQDGALMDEVPNRLQSILLHSHLSQRQEARLSRLLHQLSFINIVDFSERIAADEQLSSISSQWAAFLEGCPCKPNMATTDCECHLILRDARWYVDVIEKQFYAVVSWFASAPEIYGGTIDDVVNLRRRFPRWDARAH
jgi:hypothetical protein